MWFLFGRWIGYRDMGTVAELCPECRHLGPCAVTCRTVHFLFLPVFFSKASATFCTCEACGAQFFVEQSQYKSFVASADALEMPLETLADETNPAMLEHLQWAQRRQEFAADPDFTAIAATAEQLGQGRLSARFVQGLQEWDRLDDQRRVELTKSAHDLAQVLEFARAVVAKAPGLGGCMAGSLACLAVWSTFAVLRATGRLFLGAATGFVGLMAGPLLGMGVMQWLQWRRICRWAAQVIIPEGEKANIDFAQLAAVCLDQPAPGSIRPTNYLGPLREHALTVVNLLVAAGKVARRDET